MDNERLLEKFFEWFGSMDERPRLFFAPGRVNLIGEHTDYNGGYVLPCAIQYGTYLAVRQIEEPLIRFASENFSYTSDIPLDKLTVKINDQWVNYPLGIFTQFGQRNTRFGGLEMYFSGDIPNGAGLSSSASIEMVTAFALNRICSAGLGLPDLIKLSQRAENEFVGVNCGIMDQFAVGMGEKDHALFLNCLTLENKMVPLILSGIRLVIVNTNKKRGLADSKYNERVAECQQAVSYLSKYFDISKLGEVSFMQFYKMQDRIPDEVIRRRARHVISENQRVLNAVSALWNNEILQFGALMNASHESLRDNYEVTGIELDTLAEEAWKVNGVIGARMTGAGFGGCTVNLVREEAVYRFIAEVGENYKARTGLDAVFYLGEISDGVREITI
jgi:galactokinase